jgi:hypothetical protein
MKEVWKDIYWAPGYSVSNQGRVRSQRQQLKQCMSNSGYLLVCLSVGGGTKTGYIHRLVAEAFIANKERKPVINHKNYNKVDNRIENLEWCTPQENSRHSQLRWFGKRPVPKYKILNELTGLLRRLPKSEFDVAVEQCKQTIRQLTG